MIRNIILKLNKKMKYAVSIVAFASVLTVMLAGCKNSSVSTDLNTSGSSEITEVADKSEGAAAVESTGSSESTGSAGETGVAITAEDTAIPGEYELNIVLSGGSGKSTILSPAKAIVSDGKTTVTLEWSSPNYDYMIVDGEKYLPVNESGNSVFVVPINGLGGEMTVIADTVAMSKPHEIEYVITFSPVNDELGKSDGIGDNNADSVSGTNAGRDSDKDLDDKASGSKLDDPESEVSKWYAKHVVTGEMEFKYANNLHVTYFDDKYCIINLNGNDFYLFTDGKDIPEDLPSDISIIKKPDNNIYVVSTASFDYFQSLNALDKVAYTSFREDDMKSQELTELMDAGKIRYAGKYSAPDYEMLLSGGCSLVVENTMIYHSPDVLDQFKKLGISTIVDYSSQESSPFGRMEWIKLYGLLTGHEEEAFEIFNRKDKELSGTYEDTGKSVAYFYITDAGAVVVRKNQDYIPKLIDIAGGNYILSDDKEYDGTGTMTIQKEAFFEKVLNCDVLIYNSTISGKIKSKDELVRKCEVLKSTKAFKEDNIYCTNENFFLAVMELPEIADDISNAINDRDTNQFLYKVK